MNLKTKLKNNIANGRTVWVVHQLIQITKDNKELHIQIIALSARLQYYNRDKHRGTVTKSYLDLEINRINVATLYLIGQLPKNIQYPPKYWNWQKNVSRIVLIAIIIIVGHIIRVFFQIQKEILPIIQPANKLFDSTVVVEKTLPKEVFSIINSQSNNNVNIEVRNSAKVGIISTGDSNQFDVKQDF